MSRRLRDLALVTAAVLTVALAAVPATYAYFTDQATVAAGGPGASSTAFTSGGVATPATPTRTQTGPGAVTISWTATAVGSLGGTAEAYDVVRYAGATGGTGTVVCSTTGALSCQDTAAPAGGAWYAVRAHTGTSWFRESARVQHQPDTTAPSVVITTPLNTCAGGAVACGTASDPAGVASVTYSLRRTVTGVITGQQSFDCWNGSAWVDTPAATPCAFHPATGTTTWTVPGARATAYANLLFYTEGFTLTVRATDGVGNQGGPVTATLNP